MSSSSSVPLDKKRHLRYWTRCLRTPLPHQYTENDSTRMILAFFIMSAIELLTLPSGCPDAPSPIPSPVLTSDLIALRSWVLSLAHPSGGFCGSPNMLPPIPSAATNSPESANIAATFFALLILAMCSPLSPETAFSRVDRRCILRWLRRLQRADGSFGELVDSRGQIGGGRDMRYCYLASAIRWCLRDPDASPEENADLDFDTSKLIAYIRTAQTFDGGFGESGSHESHAGYAYCAVAALSLLDRPPQGPSAHPSEALAKGIVNLDAFVAFCVSRQFAYIEPPPDSEEDGEDDENFRLPDNLADLSLSGGAMHAAFNGRCNKVADTCYAWWVGGTMSLLSKLHVFGPSTKSTRAFLMDKTQHIIGGFSKYPGGPPDLYHAYLGLAAIAILDRTVDDLPSFDEALCVSTATVDRLVEARKGMLAREKEAKTGKSPGAGILDLAMSVADREGQLRMERKRKTDAIVSTQ